MAGDKFVWYNYTGKDIACSGVPFNWNGAAIGANPSGYLAGLRVGYIKESFENLDDDHAKANAEATLEILKKAGVCVLLAFHARGWQRVVVCVCVTVTVRWCGEQERIHSNFNTTAAELSRDDIWCGVHRIFR